MAADAKRMPAREVEFRNLILNQRIEIDGPIHRARGLVRLRQPGRVRSRACGNGNWELHAAGGYLARRRAAGRIAIHHIL